MGQDNPHWSAKHRALHKKFTEALENSNSPPFIPDLALLAEIQGFERELEEIPLEDKDILSVIERRKQWSLLRQYHF